MSSVQPLAFKLPFTHYAALGYQPVPCEGKRPVGGEGWNTKTYDYSELDRERYNVGLLCNNIVGIDIDVSDAATVTKIKSLARKIFKLPKDCPVRIGRAPKALLIARVESPMPGWDIAEEKDKKRSVLFQLLGKGKQFIVHGTHPDTGKPYTMSRALPAWDQLPLVTHEQLEQLKHAVIDLFTQQGRVLHSTGAKGVKGTGKFSDPQPWTETGEEQAWKALQALDPDMSMHEWVQVGMALHDGTHGSQSGLTMWENWSREGSKWAGTKDVVRRWKGFKAGSGTTKATLFKNDFLKIQKNSTPTRVEEEEPAGEPQDLGISASDLFAHDAGEVPWLVQDLITYGAHLLVGRPKGGKSWVTMDLALAIGSGGQFLGKQARKGKVLWIAAEDTADSLSRRLKVRGERPSRDIIVMTAEHLKAERKRWDDCTFEQWLRAYLTENPDITTVIMDTHKTCEAVWANEQIDQKRHASVVDIAYQSIRVYEDIGQETHTCIVLVHHAGKMKHNQNTDYHERINLPATAVAGCAASFVLADPPDRDIHDEDDHRRVFAIRGRHLIKDNPMLIEMKGGRITLLGEFNQVQQTEAQAEVFATIEALLEESDSTTIGEIASTMGKHKNTIQQALSRASKHPNGLVWKGRVLSIKTKTGIRWQA